MQVTFLTQALISSLNSPSKQSSVGGDTVTISRTVSALAVLYEKVRTAIEYREDHLLRRAAIERIIKRRLILNENGRGIAEYLLRELLWAKYMPENSIATSKIEDIQITIDKYIFLRNELSRGRGHKEKSLIAEWLISSAAAEVEEKISPSTERDAFINFIYQYYKDKIFLLEESDEVKNIQIYIAIHRAFAKSDNDYIRYSIMKLSFPDLTNKTWKYFSNKTKQVNDLLFDIEKHLKHPIGQKLHRAMKKEIAPFLILRDLYEENMKNIEIILSDEMKLEDEVDRTCRRRYDEIGDRLRRAGIRSVIYILATKMVFALLIEYPFEQYVLGELNFVALGINTIFPVFLMFLALLGNSPPGEDNTLRIFNRIKDIIYKENDGDHRITLALKAPNRRPILRFIFVLLYVFAFIFVFGFITAILTLLNFNPVSQFIFVFFISVILFFAYRIRQTGREYILAQRESVLSPVVNFILLPILYVGKWLSNEVARFNFFVALFDYLIEAPFKAIFEIFEEWFSFMKKQKEEIL